MPPVTATHRHPAAVLCTDCQGAVIHVRAGRGDPLVVDADPDDAGTVLVELNSHGVPEGGEVRPAQATAMRAAGRALHLRHGLTCPYASRPPRTRPGAQRAARARR